MVLEADQLTVRRLGTTVLREVGLRVERGQTVSIIGPNGAGKSTLMMALAGLLPIDGGRVLLEGRPIHRCRRREIARRLAYVPQIYDGYLAFTARDVIEAGRYAHLEPLASFGEADRGAVDEAVAACRIEPLLDRRVETLSGGERQKVWIAAALAQQSPTLLLDEPTNALDPAHQADLVTILRELTRAGRTLVVICHDLNLALALGGRVVALKEGAVFLDEPAGVLRDTARLGELFGTGFELHHGPVESSFSIQLKWRGA
ncbi:MAG TPA: ABC transporter ATP-binding protein [Phycisphaerae bacterium]|nr:ABC transporter ATP-binding protein [Phycisphaerae bacterium]